MKKPSLSIRIFAGVMAAILVLGAAATALIYLI